MFTIHTEKNETITEPSFSRIGVSTWRGFISFLFCWSVQKLPRSGKYQSTVIGLANKAALMARQNFVWNSLKLRSLLYYYSYSSILIAKRAELTTFTTDCKQRTSLFNHFMFRESIFSHIHTAEVTCFHLQGLQIERPTKNFWKNVQSCLMPVSFISRKKTE